MSIEQMRIEDWNLVIAVVTAITCGLCGSLLVIGRQSMVSEGLSHAVLPGLVIAFLLFRSFESPWLLASAAASGLVMVLLTRGLAQTRLVDADAGLGLVFSAMFSFGVLLVTANLKNVHFHADCIIEGNLALASIRRVELPFVGRVPTSLVSLSIILTMVIAFIVIAYKEIKASLFDAAHSSHLGLRPTLFGYLWIALVSLTTVAAFDIAGSILVVALTIAPAAAAFLVTQRYARYLFLSALIAAASAVAGYYLALSLDVSPTGPIASAAGAVFLFVYVLNPRSGLVANYLMRKRQKRRFLRCLACELVDGTISEPEAVKRLSDQLHLKPNLARRLVNEVTTMNWLRLDTSSNCFHVTPVGRNAIERQFE